MYVNKRVQHTNDTGDSIVCRLSEWRFSENSVCNITLSLTLLNLKRTNIEQKVQLWKTEKCISSLYIFMRIFSNLHL